MERLIGDLTRSSVAMLAGCKPGQLAKSLDWHLVRERRVAKLISTVCNHATRPRDPSGQPVAEGLRIRAIAVGRSMTSLHCDVMHGGRTSAEKLLRNRERAGTCSALLR